MNQNLLCDAHAHLGTEPEWSERISNCIPTLVCAANPREAKSLTERLRRENTPFLIPTFGLHPWHTKNFPLSAMIPYLEQSKIIGEIGMDSVWCDVPLDVQESAFRRQLAMASKQKKPVILHTKGQERTIASILSTYPVTSLIHWYSSMEDLESYMDLDCYFSIGPDVWWNPAVRRVASLVPLDRLLLETDGMGAVKWAWEEGAKNAGTRGNAAGSSWKPEAKTEPAAEIPFSVRSALLLTLEHVAKIRHLSVEDAGQLIKHNFSCFTASR